jgi:hypothetical protein
MVGRFPRAMIRAGWEAVTRDDVDIGELLAQVECPLLFAKHEGCLGSTDEGFEDAAAAFPQARTISVPTRRSRARSSPRPCASSARPFSPRTRRAL